MKTLASLGTRTLRRIYGRPLRKGAMMSWDEVKRFYWVTIFGYPIIIGLFVALLMQETLDVSGMISLALFGSLTVFGTALFAVLYGYHHRHEIDVGDEVAMDPNGIYWGAAAGALTPVIWRWVDNLLDS